MRHIRDAISPLPGGVLFFFFYSEKTALHKPNYCNRAKFTTDLVWHMLNRIYLIDTGLQGT